MGAAEPAAVAFHPALLVRAVLTGQAVERLEPVVRAEGQPARRLAAVAPEQHPVHRRTQVVIANVAGRNAAQDLERGHMAFQERLLALGGEHPVHRPPRVRHPQREQEALGHLPVQAHPQIGEVDLGLRPGRVALGHEPGHHPSPSGGPGGRLGHQLRATAVHVLRDIGVRHLRVVLGAQPLEDPTGGVPLLARRGQVLDQHRVDHLAHRVEHQRAPRRALARRRNRRGDRLPHRAPMHRILLRQRPDRHLVALPVEPDRRIQLHPRPHPDPCDIERTDEHRQIHDPPEPAHHRTTRRRVAHRHHRGWGQSRVLRPHRHRPEVGPKPRRTVGPVQSATAIAFPQVLGPRPAKVRLVNAYMARLQAAAASDASLATAFIRVIGMLDRPETLLRPDRIIRVLRAPHHPIYTPGSCSAPMPVPPSSNSWPTPPTRGAASCCPTSTPTGSPTNPPKRPTS